MWNKNTKLNYVFIIFLDTFTNMVEYLQRVPFDVSINRNYMYQDAGKRDHNFNALPQALSYILFQFNVARP